MHILWAILAGWGIAVGGMFLGLVLSALCATIVDEKSGGDAIWVVVLGSLHHRPGSACQRSRGWSTDRGSALMPPEPTGIPILTITELIEGAKACHPSLLRCARTSTFMPSARVPTVPP